MAECRYDQGTMNARQTRFVQEYCVDFNATQAAIRAGYAEPAAGQQAHELLKNPQIAAAVEARKEMLAEVAEIDAAWVLKQWKQIATADANELTQLRRINCRHCHGFGHQYQWTEAEYLAAVNLAVDSGRTPPDGMGGFGYDLNADPAPDCPECGGHGIEYMHVADTRKLKGAARRLYMGIQKTRDGIKVLTRDQDAALANIAKYLGMSKEQINLVHLEAKTLDDFYGNGVTKPGA